MAATSAPHCPCCVKKCHGCRQVRPTYNCLTVPMAKSGDMAFCAYRCYTVWDKAVKPVVPTQLGMGL